MYKNIVTPIIRSCFEETMYAVDWDMYVRTYNSTLFDVTSIKYKAHNCRYSGQGDSYQPRDKLGDVIHLHVRSYSINSIAATYFLPMH